MSSLADYVTSSDNCLEELTSRLVEWAEINSGSANLDGLDAMLAALRRDFGVLGGDMTVIELPPHKTIDDEANTVSLSLGKALSIRKRPEAPRKALLSIHYDTVYSADHPFQRCERVDRDTLRGPGVTDAKGGLLIMLRALELFESSPWAPKIGWEILVNPDEEIGSPGSAPLLAEAATRNDVGLVFEPALSDGNLVGARRGSGNFTVVARGRSAHAGRSPELGRNAINTLAEFIVRLNAKHADKPGVTLNVAKIRGGGPLNVVPDLALCGFNVRVTTVEEQQASQAAVEELIAEFGTVEGISLELHGGFGRPPKSLDARSESLYESARECASDLGFSIDWTLSGGAGDANNLAATGLPTLDGLGAMGGGIHSPEEYVVLSSLPQRAKLTALFLMKWATTER